MTQGSLSEEESEAPRTRLPYQKIQLERFSSWQWGGPVMTLWRMVVWNLPGEAGRSPSLTTARSANSSTCWSWQPCNPSMIGAASTRPPQIFGCGEVNRLNPCK
ncbi:MAG: hypothetical protein ACI835_000900 [Planctomycetota bacterium]|jgi:hypothetical protein